MANNEVWTVRGVGEDYRRKAKAAAAAYGETVGEWLERIIGMAAPFPAAEKKKSAKAGWAEYTAETVVDGPVSAEVQEAVARVPGVVGPVLEEPAAKKGRTRSCCQHGVEKGYNCWQCGGLAVIR